MENHSNLSGRACASLSALDRLQTPIWILDIDRVRVHWANRSALILWDANRIEELRSRDANAYLPDAVRRRFSDYLDAFQERRTVSERWTLYPTGQPRTFLCRCSAFEMEEGSLGMLVEAGAESQLDEPPLRSLEALRQTPVMISLYDEDGRVLFRNPSAEHALGNASHLREQFTRDADYRRARSRFLSGGGEMTARVMTVEGRRWHELTLRDTGDPATGQRMFLVSQVDVSDRVSADLAAREAREKYRALVEQSIVGTYIYQDGHFKYVNPKFSDMLGYSPAELLTVPVVELVAPADRALVEENLRKRLDGRVKDLHYRFRAVGKGGAEITLEVHGTRIRYHGRSAILSSAMDVTEKQAAENALRESERRLREITDVLGEGIYVLDAQGELIFMNPAAERILGWDEEELLGRKIHNVFHTTISEPNGHHEQQCAAKQAIASGRMCRIHEDSFIRKDGARVPVALVAAPIVRDSAVVGSVTSFHDISERLDFERALIRNEQRYRMLFNSSKDAVFVHELREDGTPGQFTEVNDVACERLGYTREELLQMGPADINDRESLAGMRSTVERLWQEAHALFERVHVCKDGRRIPVEVNAHIFEYGGERRVICSARDISERKRAEARIYRLAHYDPLTDLPNRVLVSERMRQALDQARRFGRTVAVLFVDLDGFKAVNDTFGHDGGDTVLKIVAARMRESMRRGDTVSRWSGDEFLVVLTEIASQSDAAVVAEKILAGLSRPVPLANGLAEISASIGAAFYPRDGGDAETLIQMADDAMYAAKAAGKSCYRAHDTST